MLHGKGFHNRRSPVSTGRALSAPTLTRTSGVTTYPMTADIVLPGDWQNGDHLVIWKSQDPTFATYTELGPITVTGGTGTYNVPLGINSGVWYVLAWGYRGTRPSVQNRSNIIGAGDASGPTITSANTITLASGVAGPLALTANRGAYWAITGGVNSDQFTLSGSTLTCLAQTSGGSYAVQVTATDYFGITANQTVTATLTILQFSAASFDKKSNLALSGSPPLTVTGVAAGSQMNVRLSGSPNPDKVVWQINPTTFVTGDFISFGAEDTTTDFNSAFGIRIGLTTSTGIALITGLASDSASWALDYGGAEPQTGAANDGHVPGDIYMHEFQVSTGAHSFFRVRSGVKTQLGTTVSGLSSTFKRGFACMKNNSVITANVGSSAWAATPTAGFSAYNA